VNVIGGQVVVDHRLGPAILSPWARYRYAIRARSEQVALGLARAGKQATLRVLVGFDCPVTQDMGDGDPTFDKTAADKQAAMAGQRFVFAAHERQPWCGARSARPARCRAGRHHLVVRRAAVLGASSQFEPQKDVSDSAGVEAVLQRSAVEVRQSRSRARSDIRDSTDVGRFEQSLESRPVMIGVPNAEDERHLV
jgi:hypothetical protein